MKASRSSIFIGVVLALAIIVSLFAVLGVTRTFVFDVFNGGKISTKKVSQEKAFTYDLSELDKTDPSLIVYRESNTIETGFQKVSAVAVDSNDSIYVAGDKAIRVFSSNGIASSKVELTDSPRCLAIDADGTIYAGMENHIEVYDSGGVHESTWESPAEKVILTSIAIYGENVFAADARGRIVWRYDRSGRLLNTIGKKDENRNIPGFIIPSPYFDLAVAADGLLRVANPGLHHIEAYTFNGDLEFSWGKTSSKIEGFSGCCNPVNFAILPDGRFVTCEKGLPRVKIYSGEGVFESVVAGAELFVASGRSVILDVAVDSQGRILVLDSIKKTIRVFELSGEHEDV